MSPQVLTYNTKESRVKLSFDMIGLRVILDGEMIAIFGIEMVWDAVKTWLAGIETTEADVGLRRRKLEAQIARASSFDISHMIQYKH